MTALTRAFAAIVAIAVMLPLRAAAAPGDLDPTFGSGGLDITFFGADLTAAALALVRQPDGKLVAAGVAAPVLAIDFALARYDADGALDPSFGTDGVVTTDFAGGFDAARSAQLQADGKIVAAGLADTAEGGDEFGVARYDAAGNLDPLFGVGGLVMTSFGGSDMGEALAIQADGKIVVVGESMGIGSVSTALARYDPNGALDASFGSGGRVLTDSAIAAYQVNALAMDATGRIVVAGTAFAHEPADFDFALIRYESDGTLDDSFGTGGRVTTDFSEGADEAFALVIQADGKLLAAGLTYPAGGRGLSFPPAKIVLARYDTTGQLDPTFGDGGRVVTDLADAAVAHAIMEEEDGTIVVAGSAGRQFIVAKYHADGTPDFTFGGCGRVMTDFPGTGFEGDVAYALIQQSNGDLVAGGSTFNGVSEGFALARYANDGLPLCPQYPASSCVASSRPRTSVFSIQRGASRKKDALFWALHHGDGVAVADFGDPRTTDAYALCLYDASMNPATLVFAATAPAGGRCRGADCWGTTREGFAFVDPRRNVCGVRLMRLRAGSAGHSEVTVRGRGAALALPRLPLPTPVRVQLRSTNGRCWEVPLPRIVKNDVTDFQVRGQ